MNAEVNQNSHYEPIADPRIVEIKRQNTGVLGVLARARGFRKLFPCSIKRFFRWFLPRDQYNQQLLLADPFYYAKEKPDYVPRHSVQIGIIADHKLTHKYPIAACFDLGVDYRLIDITASDWIEKVKACPCEMFLVHPSIDLRPWRQMYDERLKILTETLNKRIFPSYPSLWLYESKHRMHYWLKTNGFSAPRSWVFYRCSEALEFCRCAEIPIVYKSDLGSGASGVKIFRNREPLIAFVKRYFKTGFRRRGNDPRDREWGGLLLQEYISDAREWRMIRIGDSFFGYEKVKIGDFHSGSHAWRYGRPSDELLNLLKCITDRGDFKSMDLDVFQTTDGRLLVNELQAVFGMGNPYEMCVIDDQAGRMLWDAERKTWVFEPGSFCQNYMWNLRLQYILNTL